MRLGPIFRVLAALVYGIIGYYLGIAIANTTELTTKTALIIWPATIAGVVLGYVLAPWISIAPARAARNSLRTVPMSDLLSGTIGFCTGLIIAALLSFPLSRLPAPFGPILPIVAVIIFGYLGTTILVLRKDDFFTLVGISLNEDHGDGDRAAKSPGRTSMILDTSVIIDGRIADIAETGFLLGSLLVPRFVLNELQYIADSADTLRRNRGRRGLEILDRLQQDSQITLDFTDQDPQEAQQVDDKLVILARNTGGAIVTNDYNLNRVAQLQGVTVLNINELANAVKVVLLPGEEFPIKIIQEGKESGQGVGYLDDGTMVVVENGRRFLHQEILVEVTKVLQTSAGRLIFAVPDGV